MQRYLICINEEGDMHPPKTADFLALSQEKNIPKKMTA